MSLPRILVVNGEAYIRASTVRREEMEASEFARSIIEVAASVSGIRPIEITGRSRAPRLSPIRAACIAVMRDQGNMTWEDIGDSLGGRDHSTVLNCHGKHAGSATSRKVQKRVLDRLKLRESEGE